MKKLITFILILVAMDLSGQISLRDDLLDNASSGGTWTLLSPVNPVISAQLTNDNPSIDFTPHPFGAYEFMYRVCSIAKPTLCKETVTAFYSLDFGEFAFTPDTVCLEDSIINLSTLFTTFTPGADALYSWDVPSQFILDDNGTAILTDDTVDISNALSGAFIIKLICTPQNPDPSIYDLDPNCTPITYDVILNLEICCPITTIGLTVLCTDN